MEKRCHFWLPKKNRFCANIPFNHSLFCGNHTSRSNAKWVPCPIDPSHCVLEENMEAHIKKCPLLKQTQTLLLQPYYQKGVNCCKLHQQEGEITCEMKRNWVYNLTISQFIELLSKIRSFHASFCKDIGYSYKLPPACDVWIKRQFDRNLPYQEKHVLQQASILGNLEDIGVISGSAQVLMEEQSDHTLLHHCKQDDISAVVEFGAGRGYLTQILADCYGIEKVILVERKSYKLKADRSLRQKNNLALERLRIDIEDLNLNAVESLRGTPYLAIGKHLCGPATDLTLRCCLSEHSEQDNGIEHSNRTHLRGIAVATCCHHLCQWKHYTNKQYLKELGVTKEEFHAITWFTSWAVDADHGSDIYDDGSLHSSVPPCDNNDYGGGVDDFIKNMKAVERAALGFMCKDIIDIGRLMWIKECGLEAELVKYVPLDVSPENRLLVAKASAQHHLPFQQQLSSSVVG